jgi:hypothetical protein
MGRGGFSTCWNGARFSQMTLTVAYRNAEQRSALR